MASKYLDYEGLVRLWGKIKTNFVAKEANKGLSTNDYTTTEKNKLSGIAANAEVNQNTFSTIAVVNSGNTTNLVADSKTDTATLQAGANITLTGDANTDKVTIAAVVPTKISQLTNDSNYVTSADILEGVAAMTAETAKAGTSTTANTISAAVLKAAIDNSTSTYVKSQDLFTSNTTIIDSSHLPSYVDDVIECKVLTSTNDSILFKSGWLVNNSNVAITPETGKIYVINSNGNNDECAGNGSEGQKTQAPVNSQWRWGGSTFIKLNDGGVSAITDVEINSITSA